MITEIFQIVKSILSIRLHAAGLEGCFRQLALVYVLLQPLLSVGMNTIMYSSSWEVAVFLLRVLLPCGTTFASQSAWKYCRIHCGHLEIVPEMAGEEISRMSEVVSRRCSLYPSAVACKALQPAFFCIVAKYIGHSASKAVV